MIVRLEHLRLPRGFNSRPGFCHPRAREWFKRHGFDWNDFRHNGIDSARLLATGDALALALVRAAEAAEAAEGAGHG